MSKLIFISIVLWLAVMLIVVLLIVPGFESVSALTETNNILQEKLNTLKVSIVDQEKLRQDYESHREQADKARTALPSREDLPELIAEMTALSSKNGLLLNNLSFITGAATSQGASANAPASEAGNATPTFSETAPETEATSVQPQANSGPTLSYSTTIRLSLAGSYDSFKNFLEDVEKDLRLLDLRDLSIKPQSQNDSLPGGLFTYELSLETYFLPNKSL
ncbi:MAG: hypothetical protein COS76_02375 [Candidatus Portnoybacteria bacterium CG06_land_8_20_14_3_00_39_12]|uniref:Type 4a pilus biogenesis protein PilO n=1 Tax=Candidatus Portnoybacteria bacterium CG06_land_8_20_14_3_00_39_12 TaxID=1974809 RepID=A0A2M7AX01_9BACT|nr:MAG: hypothetical protein COS76_02375 [Candidatus Portnoybacteria bacterium CG06_land_8_20_14_3_00_39_12]